MMKLLLLLWLPIVAQALTYDLPTEGNLIGQQVTVYGTGGQSLAELGKEHDLSLTEIKEANPQLNDISYGKGTKIKLPTQFILPPGDRTGIVINLSEMRLYYYHQDARQVSTYPIGIGKEGWATPVRDTRVIQKKENPAWRVPKSIRAKAEAQGNPLPAVVPAGPTNPLGDHAIRLNIPGYLIHGTRKPDSIGTRASHGCVRMWNEDVAELFAMISLEAPVRIVHQPYKVGIKHNLVFLESHEPLSEHVEQKNSQLSIIAKKIMAAIPSHVEFNINWLQAEEIANAAKGFPVSIGKQYP